jgi:hypothetical protein
VVPGSFRLTPLCSCTTHSGGKKGQRCGDIELSGYLTNATGPVPLVLDLRIDLDRFGSSSDLSINGHLHYPNDVEMSLNETVSDKYRTDCDNNSSNTISFMSVIAS